MALTVIDHPAAQHYLSILRDKETPSERFRKVSDILASYVVIAATRDLPVEDFPLNTPLEPAIGKRLAGKIVVVPILRAGLGMLQPVVDILPEVEVGFVGLERDEETALARSYYCKLPPLEGKRVLLVDPMLATGGSASYAIEFIKERGGEDLCFACIVAAPEGVRAIEEAHPDLPIFTAGLDRELNDQKYICPGLGDYGDRLYYT